MTLLPTTYADLVKLGDKSLCSSAAERNIPRNVQAGNESAQTGHDLLQGYAASLRQQAKWIREALDPATPETQRITFEDIDVEELERAADQLDAARKEAQSFEAQCDFLMAAAFIECAKIAEGFDFVQHGAVTLKIAKAIRKAGENIYAADIRANANPLSTEARCAGDSGKAAYEPKNNVTTYCDLVKLLDLLTEQFPELRECLARAADSADAHERRTKRITQSVGE